MERNQDSLEDIELSEHDLIDLSLEALSKQYYKYRFMHLLAKRTLLNQITQKKLNPEAIKQLAVATLIGTYFFRYLAVEKNKKNSLEALCHTESLWYEDENEAGRKREDLQDRLKWMGYMKKYYVVGPSEKGQMWYPQALESEISKKIVKVATVKDAQQVLPFLQNTIDRKENTEKTFYHFNKDQKQKLLEILENIQTRKYKYTCADKPGAPLEVQKKNFETHFLKIKRKLELSLAWDTESMKSKKLSDIVIHTN